MHLGRYIHVFIHLFCFLIFCFLYNCNYIILRGKNHYLYNIYQKKWNTYFDNVTQYMYIKFIVV